jgi:hypothetical protein
MWLLAATVASAYMRALLSSCAQIFWASYLSAMASKKGSSTNEELQRLEPAYLAQKEL